MSGQSWRVEVSQTMIAVPDGSPWVKSDFTVLVWLHEDGRKKPVFNPLVPEGYAEGLYDVVVNGSTNPDVVDRALREIGYTRDQILDDIRRTRDGLLEQRSVAK